MIYNRLIVKGNPTRVHEFLESVKSKWDSFDFERIVPSPDIFPHPASGRERSDDWFYENWGTNHNCCDVELDESTVHLGYVIINFETAWSPPAPILRRLQEMFPDMDFSCRWSELAEYLARYNPRRSLAVARSEWENAQGEHCIATLYLTEPDVGEFFLVTEIMAETCSGYRCVREENKEMSVIEADEWMLKPESKPLVLLYPELRQPKTEGIWRTDIVGRTRRSLVTGRNDELSEAGQHYRARYRARATATNSRAVWPFLTVARVRATITVFLMEESPIGHLDLQPIGCQRPPSTPA